MDTNKEQKTFLSIFLRTLTYLTLIFIIVSSFMFADMEYSIYTTVPPQIPTSTPKVPAPLTESEKFDIINSLQDDKKSDPVTAAKDLKAIPKPKSMLSEEEKNLILQGL